MGVGNFAVSFFIAFSREIPGNHSFKAYNPRN